MSIAARAAAGALLLAAAAAPDPAAAQAPPDTDVYLASLQWQGDSLTLEGIENLTARTGYDNQPSFTPDGRQLLYTMVGADGRADVWRYDLDRGEAARVTRTPESEYSPTPIPGSRRFSVVRVECDSTQRLWSFELDGSDPSLVLPDVQPVGYHAWASVGTVAVYVLGEPSTLRVASPGPGEARVAARGVGRSLQRIPGTGAVSFVALRDAGGDWIMRLDPGSGQTRRIAPALEGSVDHAWSPGGTLLMGQGSVLYRWEPADDGQWIPVADMSRQGIRSITRLAVSPGGERIALVAEPAERRSSTSLQADHDARVVRGPESRRSSAGSIRAQTTRSSNLDRRAHQHQVDP